MRAGSLALTGIQAGCRVPLEILPGATVEYFLPARLAPICAVGPPEAASEAPDELDWLALPFILNSLPFAETGSAPTLNATVAKSPNPRVEIWPLVNAMPSSLSAIELEAARRACGFADVNLRRTFAWVGGNGPRDAWLVPPPESAVPGLLSDCFEFSRRRDVDPSLKANRRSTSLARVGRFRDANRFLGPLGATYTYMQDFDDCRCGRR